ncbi:MAG: hypothetical protein ACI4BA_05950 [Prevotella sp.]
MKTAITNFGWRKMMVSFLAALSFSWTVTACSDDDNNATEQTPDVEVVPNPPVPTNDLIKVTYDGKACFMGSDATDFGQALANRMNNRTAQMDEDAQVVVVTPNTLQTGITTEQAAYLIRQYDKGASLILVEPAKSTWERMIQTVKNAETLLESTGYCSDNVHSFLQRMEIAIAQNNAGIDVNNVEKEAVAFRFNDTYVVNDLEIQARNCIDSTMVSITDENGNTSTATVEANDACEVTPYNYGKSADLLVNWVKNAEASKNQMEQEKAAAWTRICTHSAASNNLKDLMEAQKFTVQSTVGPSAVRGTSMLCEYQCYVYTLFDFNKEEEYYMVRVHAVFHASDLGSRDINEKDKWIECDKWIRTDKGIYDISKCFGPYMKDAHVHIRFYGKQPELGIYDASPSSTTSGSHGYTSGTSFSITGNAGLSGDNGVQGGSVSWSWSESYTHSESDLSVKRSSSDPRYPNWKFEGIRPHVITHLLSRNEHETVGTFQINDWDADMTWYWRFKNTDRDGISTISINPTEMIGEISNERDDEEFTTLRTCDSGTFNLIPPSRYYQEWVMSCTDEALLKNIKDQLKISWDSNTTTYAVTKKEIDENMVKRFDNIKNNVSAIADILKAQGYTGKYTFMVRKQGDPANFRAFTLDNGVVRDGAE